MKLRIGLAALLVCAFSILPVMSNDTIAPPEADRQLKVMENKFFSHDFSKETEEYRIQRLEKFAFGSSRTGNMDERLGKLEKVIDMHKAMIAQTPQVAPVQPAPQQTKYSRQLDDTAAQQSPHDKMKWVEDYKPRPASSYAQPMASVVPEDQRLSDEDPLEQVMPGAQRRLEEITRTLAQPLPVPSHLSHLTQVYDPSVFGDVPPDHHARMLTRVAWCEQHAFGRTYPELHLPQRLLQLSAKLLPAQQQTTNGFELMDQLDLLVREVVMQQHPPIASLPQH